MKIDKPPNKKIIKLGGTNNDKTTKNAKENQPNLANVIMKNKEYEQNDNVKTQKTDISISLIPPKEN